MSRKECALLSPDQSWKEIALGVWSCGEASKDALTVVGGVHGDEQVGAELIQSWCRAPSPAEHSWYLRFALGNPEALQAGQRYLDFDLNRAFGPQSRAQGRESERADLLRHALQSTKVLVDIHQTHCDTPPLAVVKETPAHLAFARALGLRVAVVDAERIYGPSMMADWVDSEGGLGITLESGRSGTIEARHAAEALVDRLVRRDWEFGATIRVYAVREILRAPWHDFTFARSYGNGSPVAAGEVLGEAHGETLRAPAEGVLLLPRARADKGAPAAVFAEDLGELSLDHSAWQGLLSCI